MNILIINGSPKGKNSTTVHTCLFLEKKFPEHKFNYINAGQKIRQFEKDFSPALQAIDESELILFSYPVYTFLVPAQLHRFIELMKESGKDFSGKIASQISTSKHFYDITAHRFIEDNCADMCISYLDGLSADMDDLTTETGRTQAIEWFKLTLWQMEKGYFKKPSVQPMDFMPVPMESSDETSPATTKNPVEKDCSKCAVIVTDYSNDTDGQLKAMVNRFQQLFKYKLDIINIAEFPFSGGCISCFNCAASGKCVQKDGFDDYLRNTIHKHDAIMYGFKVKDHSMGALFKTYDDRQFCNGHRTVTMGTPFGYIVSGPYSKEENLRMLLEGRAQVGSNYLAGVATDEVNPDAELRKLADTMAYAMEHRYCPPQNFLGIGGMKIFRDLIYMMRGLMRADHKFFKSHGQYDFPQKKWKTSMAMYLVGPMMSNPKIKAKMGSKISEGMIAPYKKALEDN